MEAKSRQQANPKRRERAAARPSGSEFGANRRGPSQAPKAPGRARGLNRAVEIFQLLHVLRKPVSIGEIAKKLKAPRSTIYEIVNLFLSVDILEYVGAGSEVYFGRAIHLYAHDYFATHALLRQGQEEVRRLAALTDETCQLCMPVGNKYVVVSMQNSARLFRIGSDIGVLVPIPWTASGRLFVAHMTLAELRAFIPPEDFRMQDGGAINPERFLAEAKEARKSGISIISGLVDDYAMCLAAPIVDPDGKCIACICFIISNSRGRDRVEELVGLLKESARKLSHAEAEMV